MHQADATPGAAGERSAAEGDPAPIRGYARIEGSNFDARDFILVAAADPNAKQTNAREVLQKALLEKVRPQCRQDLGVEIRASCTGRLAAAGGAFWDQIASASWPAWSSRRTPCVCDKSQAEQELKAKEELQQQAKEKVEAETRLVQAKTKAGQAKEVEESRLRQELASAVALEASRKTAEATLSAAARGRRARRRTRPKWPGSAAPSKAFEGCRTMSNSK